MEFCKSEKVGTLDILPVIYIKYFKDNEIRINSFEVLNHMKTK